MEHIVKISPGDVNSAIEERLKRLYSVPVKLKSLRKLRQRKPKEDIYEVVLEVDDGR